MMPASAGFLLGSLLDPKDEGYVPPKCLVFSELHDITIQKTTAHVHCCENIKYNNLEQIHRQSGLLLVLISYCTPVHNFTKNTVGKLNTSKEFLPL
jgi:hypothetical protein